MMFLERIRRWVPRQWLIRSRFPEGMTERKTTAIAEVTASCDQMKLYISAGEIARGVRCSLVTFGEKFVNPTHDDGAVVNGAPWVGGWLLGAEAVA
jgi:hypothetical protein